MGVTSDIRAINHVKRDFEGKGGSYRGNFGGMEHKGTVFAWVDHAMNELSVQRGLIENQDQKMEKKLAGLKAELVAVEEGFK